MRLLVTRPRENAESIAAALTAHGYSPMVAPLMELSFRDGTPLALDGVQAVAATSANGVRAAARRTERRDIPLYAVGPQTAEAARAAGFRSVHSADGDSAALVEKIAAELDPKAGRLFHASGVETAGRFREALRARGFTVDSEVLYEAIPVPALPENAARALRDNALDGVLLFSPRTAKIFANLVAESDLAENCARLEAYCISAATAAALGKLAFARVAVAGNPNQEAMFALLAGAKS